MSKIVGLLLQDLRVSVFKPHSGLVKKPAGIAGSAGDDA
jgi:hypothetical protein